MKDVEKTQEHLIAQLEALRRDNAQLRQQLPRGDISSVERRRATERVRAEAMAMASGDDLPRLIGTISEEITHLGIDRTFTGNFIRFVDEAGVRIDRHYYAIPNPKKYGLVWTSAQLVELNEELAVGQAISSTAESDQTTLDAWRRKEPISTVVSTEAFAARLEILTNFWGLNGVIPLPEKEDLALVYVPFEYGVVQYVAPALVQEHLAIVQELTEGLSLGYIRYLDFQRLAAKNHALEENLRLLRETQNQLVMQEKMASLGDLVAGIAHEMNTPLGAISSTGHTLTRALDKLKERFELRFPAKDKDNRAIQSLFQVLINSNQVMADGTERLSGIISSLRNFARLDEAKFQVVDIHEGIDSALTLLESQIEAHITVVKNYTASRPIYCAPGQLNQVFMHLLKNALQAIEGPGQITISSAETDVGIRIRIGDTGKGIPADQLERIFDFDFHATDQRMKMGFGLSTDYRIIQDHKGMIKIESEAGKGTIVTIDLPREIGSESV